MRSLAMIVAGASLFACAAAMAQPAMSQPAQLESLSREQLMTAVWGPSHHGTMRTIDNFVLRLRDKLEDHPDRPLFFETVRGIGYRFTLSADP